MTKKRPVGNPSPAYFRLQQAIQDQVEGGRLMPGERIPPERRLAEIHKVSVGTVTKAILNLVHAGYLYRAQGRGTFVAGTTLRRESLRYYRSLREFGDQEADLKIRLLELKTVGAIPSVNRYLRVGSEEGLYELHRLVLSEDRPVVYCVSYLPCGMFKDLEEFPPSRLEKIPFYSAIEESYGLPTLVNHELISAMRADEEVARLLEIRRREPILLIEMVAFTYRERPYEYRRSHCLTGLRKIFREY